MSNLDHTPPRYLTRFLQWFCNPDYYEDLSGDLEEEYRLYKNTHTAKAAGWWYSWQVIRLFRPAMFRSFRPIERLKTQTDMYRNYLKIGLRNLWKFKAATAINVIGLSTGLAAFVLIALFVLDEFSYDRHHEHADNVYRVTVKNYTRDGNVSRHWAFASAGHAKRLKEDYSEITHSVRFFPWAFPDIIHGERTFRSEQVVFADNDVFDIFSFNFIEGNPENAFDDLFSIVLTESSAIKIFGNNWQEQNIVGQQVKLTRDGMEAPFKVTGVMENMPDQQHFHFDYLAPIRFVENVFGQEASNNVGGNYNWLTYIRATPEANIGRLQADINENFWDKYIGDYENGDRARLFYDFNFQPMLDIHLYSQLESEIETNGSIDQVYIFSIIGILLLLVACVNYMNIATSHYSRRMKEVGVRQVIGAVRSALVKQFLTESTLITTISFPVCTLLIFWALPYLNDFTGKNLSFNIAEQLSLILPLLLLLFGVGLLAGLYPAFFLSRIKLVNALKGEQAMNNSKWNFRSWLVTFQYAVTIALIFAIGVIENQMHYIRNSNPGYQREQVLSLSIPRNVNTETFRNELLSDPGISSASFSSRIPTGRLLDNRGLKVFQGDSTVSTNFRLPSVNTDKYFLDTYQIPLVAGENFRDGTETVIIDDTTTTGYYIINESAANSFGFDKPADAVGFKIAYGPTEGRIIGVMADFHFESLHSPIVPMLLMNTDNYRTISLKLASDNVRETLGKIENIYTDFSPEIPANYRFVDELFEEQYQSEKKLSTIIKVFAVIAILISCLGLIGMVGFIIETKLKEIGIRKVLGASTKNILMLVSGRFVILSVIAFAVALPVTYYFMDMWLENFVYRTQIGWFLILLPIVMALGITLLIISYQTIKAAMMNPVDCLSDE
ncbi:MAG: ABC transporter permease [Cyclobacteriaceae bacterium]